MHIQHFILNGLLLLSLASDHVICKKDFLVITVASEETDGYRRFIRSCQVNGLKSKVLGLGEEWLGGNIEYEAGGGYKINLLRNELSNHKDKKNLVVMFTDSYDVITTARQDDILKAFDKFNAKIVFGAEDFCWPNKSLATQYPRVSYGYKYLNSGGFIGYAPELYTLVSYSDIGDKDDDQLYYTKMYLDETARNKLAMKLDNQAKIFQNLNGNAADVALEFHDDDTRLVNTVFKTNPMVIHGNGPSKTLLNSLGNYLAHSWTKKDQCIVCMENRRNFVDAEDSSKPLVLVGVFIEKPLPFLEEMLESVVLLNYPKQRIHLFVHSQVEHHAALLEKFIQKVQKSSYASVKYVPHNESVKDWHARNSAVQKCLDLKCDALFSIDGDVHLDNPDTLTFLLSCNRPVLAAMITRVGKAWSTFWGAITEDGYYARSSDYMDIVNYERRGIWNVPYIAGAYVMLRSVLEFSNTRPNYINNLLDSDMAMAANFRKKGVFMYVTNLMVFGHLVDADIVSTKHLHNDLWQVAINKQDWERRYIHPDYVEVLNPDKQVQQPCPDVYWFPTFSERFAKELIEMMEHLGQWSSGGNKDPRLAGGYENVPTVDIHMNQVEYEEEWLYILKTYIKPVAEKIFLGYTSDARAIMNFVVKYHPSEQYYLRPHHDSSTYTINIGLNRPGIDYQGGGARFIRYNCSVTATRVGWSLMHPGRLTHWHEGLPTTEGTRYIMISFVDP